MQTKLMSVVETITNQAIGLCLSALIWVTIGPLFGYAVLWLDAFGFSSVFMVASFVRSYIVRRAFNYANVQHEVPRLRKRVGSIQSLQGQVGMSEVWQSQYQDLALRGIQVPEGEGSYGSRTQGDVPAKSKEDKELRK